MATVNRESLVRDNRRISIQIERLATEALLLKTNNPTNLTKQTT